MWPFRRRSDEDFRREIDAHIELETDRLIAEGLGRDEARVVARRTFGNVTAARERFYESGRTVWLDDLRQDVRFALRTFRRSPGFVGVAVLTLALGAGANTAVFSVVNSIVLRPLPYPDSDRLVRIIEVTPPMPGPAGVPRFDGGLNTLELEALRAQTRTLSHVGIYREAAATLTGVTETTRLQGIRLSPAVLSSLRVQPLIGRLFDDREEADPVVVLAHPTWQRYFGADPAILGRVITLDGTAHTVVGVMPPGFEFPSHITQFWMPTPLPAGRLAVLQRMVPLARVNAGVPIDTVRAEVAAVVARVRQEAPPEADMGIGTPGSGEFTVVGLQDQLVAPVRPALLILSVAVAFVLLIACVNVANLLLARGAARRQEIAVRGALGARRGRLVRQLLTESLLLALAGSAAGTALALAGVHLLRTLGATLPRADLVAPAALPRLADVTIDLRVLAFALAVSIVTGIVFGLAPAVHQLRSQGAPALRHRLSYPRTQGALVVAELTLAMMLLVGGGLLMHSFARLSNVDPGYDAANVLTFQLVTPPGRYSGPQMAALAEDLVSRLEAEPAVRAAGYTELLPMVRFRTGGRITRVSETAGPPAAGTEASPEATVPDTFTVSPHFLDAMGIRVVAGRGFDGRDRAGQPGVALINRTLARTGFLGPDPLGERISALKQTWEVVGIVDDVQQFGLDQDPIPQVFFDMRQTPAPGATARVNYFVVRTAGEPTALVSGVRAIVRQLDPEVTVDLVAPMEQLVANSISRPRLYAVLLGIFAGIAAALAIVGMYGVMTYTVAQRTQEIGIRMALGAPRAAVVSLVLRQGLVLTATGLAAGVLAATMVTRYLESMLFGVTPLDPATFLAVSVMFAAVAAVAAYVPARRATAVSPLVALRYE